MGACVFLLVAVLLTEPVRAAVFVHDLVRPRRQAPTDPTRRTTLSRLLGGTAALLGLGTSVVGVTEALSLVVQRVRVPLRKLPRAMDGTRLVQISDVHVGATIRRDYVEEVVARVNALSPTSSSSRAISSTGPSPASVIRWRRSPI